MHTTMSIALILTLFLCFVLPWLVILIKEAANQRNKKQQLNTPPGSLGFPLIGETLKFMKPHPSTSLGEFLDLKLKRYGKIFKTHILGNPTILSADIGFNQFVLKNDEKLFGRSFPKFVNKLLAIGEMGEGADHRLMKNIIGYFLGIPNLQSSFLDDFQVYTLRALESWEEDIPFSGHEETRKLTFYMITKSIFSLNPGEQKAEELRKLFATFSKGFYSLPINLPWTNFRRAVKSRKAIVEIIERLKGERSEKKKEENDGKSEGDCLDMVLKHPSMVTTERDEDNIVSLILAGHETSAAAIALAMYFLGGCQEAVRQLREEHIGIARKKEERGDNYLSWEDYRQMEFTQCVMSETLRLGNIAFHLHRKALVSSRFEGYDIPEGWSVILVFPGTHLDREVYPETQRFNPWRWQRTSINKAMVQNYMPFSEGLHKCPGMGLAKMEMAIFLHYLVLKYDWELMAPEEQPISRILLLEFSRGMLLKVHRLPPNLPEKYVQ